MADFGNPLNAFAQGWDQAQGMQDQFTRNRAGSALARGDQTGAMNAFYRGGMVDQGRQVQGDQIGLEDRRTKLATDQATQQKAAAAQKLGVLGQATDALLAVPEDQDGSHKSRSAFLHQRIEPLLTQLGLTDPALAQQLASADLSTQSLQSFRALLGQKQRELQIVATGGGGYNAVDPATGQTVSSHAPSVFSDNQTYVSYDNGGQPAPAAQGQPAASAPAPAQSGGENYLARLAQVESNGDPNAKNGSSTGIYQFHPDTFARLGGADINDPAQQKAAALKLAQESAQTLQQAGIQPDDANLYIMHQQGAGGGLALLKADPNANAIQALTPVYGNPTRARQAIVNNGGTPDMTAGQFVGMWRQKWGQGAQSAAQPYQVASNGETPPPPGNGSGFNLPPGAHVIHAAGPKAKDAPSGYRWAPNGTDLVPIHGGPADTGSDMEPIGPGDPESGSILAQTGLSMPAFLAITGQASKLPRDAATRNAAFRQAEEFANKRGVDLSTMGSQYDAYNKTLQSNIMRNNQTNILEQEISGTVSVLQPIADQAGMGRLRVGNVAKLFAGKEFNDPNVQQYRQQLLILQSELAGMNAAARGNIDQSGNVKTDQGDMDDAARVIVNGLNSRGAGGLAQAIHSTTSKNRTVLENNIDASRKAIWETFGVGQHYKPQYGPAARNTAGASKGLTPAQLTAVQRFKGSSAPGGSAGNPVVTRTKADYDRLPSGTHYVFRDGRILVKP